MRNFNVAPRSTLFKFTLLAGLGSAVLAGCGTEYTVSGDVHKGGDGQEYVIPANAHRAVYKDKADCDADIKAHEDQIKKANNGQEVNPDDVCEPVTNYRPLVYPRSYYYGMMTSSTEEWPSSRIVVWSPVRDGQFAAKGETLPHNVASAPNGATEGEHTSVTEHEGGIFDDPLGGVHGGVGGGEGGDGGGGHVVVVGGEK